MFHKTRSECSVDHASGLVFRRPQATSHHRSVAYSCSAVLRRYGSIVEPMTQWAKTASIEKGTQVIPCRAGILSAVVYSNGDVSVCELHEPLGNIREKPFEEIWHSPKANELRRAVACKECWCTTEVFLWPSMVFQPARMVQAMVGAKVWRSVKPLDAGEEVRVDLSEAYGGKSEDLDSLLAIQT